MVSEETKDPRRSGPKALLRALVVSLGMGIVLVLLALMAAKDLHAPQLSTTGFPYVIHSVLGKGFGDVILVAIAIAVFGAGTAIMATGVRIIFAMARDGALPFSKQLSHVSDRFHTPVTATVLVTVVGFLLLVLNYGNPQIFATISSVAILLFYATYLFVLGPMLIARLKKQWPRESHGGYFSLGRWGLLVNVIAFLGALAIVVNVAWPRVAIYGNAHWYLQYAGVEVIVLVLGTGLAYFGYKSRTGEIRVIDEHRAVPGVPTELVDELRVAASGAGTVPASADPPAAG
jgi:amino acid transporter